MKSKNPNPKEISCGFILKAGTPSYDKMIQACKYEGYDKPGAFLRYLFNLYPNPPYGQSKFQPPAEVAPDLTVPEGLIRLPPDKPSTPDWDKGDPLPENLAPEPTPQVPNQVSESQFQIIIDRLKEPMNVQLPKPLSQQRLRVVDTPKPQAQDEIILIPSNIKMLNKVYFLDNYYQSRYGTDGDREASPSWMKQLLEGHSIRLTGPRPALTIINAHLNDMLSKPLHELKQWIVPNPRWPQADKYVWNDDGTLKNFEI